jgi:hypothetical protein
MFQRCILPPSSGSFITLMMEAVHTSETSVIALITPATANIAGRIILRYVLQKYGVSVQNESVWLRTGSHGVVLNLQVP